MFETFSWIISLNILCSIISFLYFRDVIYALDCLVWSSTYHFLSNSSLLFVLFYFILLTFLNPIFHVCYCVIQQDLFLCASHCGLHFCDFVVLFYSFSYLITSCDIFSEVLVKYICISLFPAHKKAASGLFPRISLLYSAARRLLPRNTVHLCESSSALTL